MKSSSLATSSAGRVRTVIEPNRQWIRINWIELFEYRDLMLLFFRRDHVARYKQTILGPTWYVLQPLATAVIFSVVFGRIAGITTEGVPHILFYLGGLLGWNLFAQSLNSTSSVFTSNADLFAKAYFPRLVVPLAAVLSNAITFVLQFSIFLAFYTAQKHGGGGDHFGMSLGVLLLPLLVLQAGALGLGAGLWLSSMTAKYRDLRYATSFMVSSLMFVTPVIYPLSTVPPEFTRLIQLNPMTAIVESFRIALLGAGTVEAGTVAWSIAVTAVVLWSGILVFQRTEGTVIDTV